MPEDFRGPNLKIERAKHHIDDLQGLLDRFMVAQSYIAVADFDLDPGNICWVARGEDVFPHDEFSPIIGDAIHNLRDALDLAISVLMRNDGKSDIGAQFPTGTSVDHFRATISERAKKAPFPAMVTTILKTRIEPYKGGRGRLLRVLHDMAIRDKHRLIVPTIFGVRGIEMQTEGMDLPLHVFGPRRPIKDGVILARIGVADLPNIDPSDEAQVSLEITFDERSGALRWESIDTGIRRLLYATEEAIESLATCLVP